MTNVSIQGWLGQFNDRDRDLGARVLDVVEFYGQSLISASYRQALNSLPGWSKDAKDRKGKWRFAAMSGSAGESGDAMLHQFRVANNLDGKKYNALFVARSELFRQLPEDDPDRLGEDDVVVLLDDFSGTGEQVCNAWNDPVTSFGALLAGVGKIYLVLVLASKKARQRIISETGMSPVAAHELNECDNVFSNECTQFSEPDKQKLLNYGKIADKKRPKGFGDCGFVVVFQHRTPNDSIPILHATHAKWTGLFPRHYE